MKRTQWFSGVWEDVTQGLNMACCSCGYVHDFTFKIVGKKVFTIVHLDNRTTAQVRRRRKFPCLPSK